MEPQEIPRLGVIELREQETMADACARMTTLIRDHGWELQEVVFNLAGEGGPVHAKFVLVNRAADAEPSDFGYRVEPTDTRPL